MTSSVSLTGTTSDVAHLLRPDELRTGCASCSLRELCLPVGLSTEDMNVLERIIKKRKRVFKGGFLYRADDRFTSLYAIKLGHFKTYQTNYTGDRHITGFQMASDVLGLDAISTDRHQCDAVALEDSEVCEIPFAQLAELFGKLPILLRQFHRMMSHEITREQTVMLLLGNMSAEQRLATFLVNLSSRYEVRGFSPTAFQLRMTREEIGNYLSLTIESISRLISRLKRQHYIEVHNREVQIIDLPRLRKLAAGTDALKE